MSKIVSNENYGTLHNSPHYVRDETSFQQGETTYLAVSSASGTSEDLPDHVRRTAKITGEVVAWTSLDPEIDGPGQLNDYYRRKNVLYCIFMTGHNDNLNVARETYWILTNDSLKIIVRNKKGLFCSVGHVVKTVPLKYVRSCGVSIRDDCMSQSVPIIYVKASNSMRTHFGVGLENPDWFVESVKKQQREVVLKSIISPASSSHQAVARLAEFPSSLPPATVVGLPATVVGVPASSASSAEERLAEIENLKEKGLITVSEHEEKRKGILATI